MNQTLRDRLLMILLIFLVWEGATSWLKLLDPFLFPTPMQVLRLLIEDAVVFGKSILSSMVLLVSGYLLAVFTAIPLGLIVGWNRRVHRAIEPITNLLGPIPPVVYIPYAIALLPTFKVSSIFVIFIGAFWPLFINTVAGVQGVERGLIQSALTLGLTQGTAALFSLTEIFDLSARGRLDTAFLSGVQIDSRGDINMSVIGDFAKPKVRLPGGAGSAAIMPTAKRTLMWRTKHDRKVFVENLSFRTASGRVDKVVTPLCVFSKEEGRLKVWRIHPGVTWKELQENTGFPLEKSADFAVTEEPTAEELRLLEQIDPEKGRIIEF